MSASSVISLILRGEDQGASGVLDTVSGRLGGLGGILSGAASFAIGGIITSGINAISGAVSGLSGEMISGNSAFEQYETQFSVLLGSTEAAQQRMEELAAFGASTPFELPGVVEADRILQGFGLHSQEAAEQFGFSGAEIRTIAGDVASGTGSSFQEMASLIGRFSAGATGEAISRMQELGITTRAELAGMGLEFSSSGQLLSPLPDAMSVVLELMNEKYGGMMEAQSTTFAGMVSNLQDWKSATLRTIGEPIFEVLKDKLGSVLEFLSSPAAQTAVASFASTVANGIGVAIDFLNNQALPAAQNFFGWLTGTGIPALQQFAAPIIAQVVPALQNFGDWFSSVGWPAIQEFIGNVLSQLIPGLQQLGQWISQIATAVAPLLAQAFQWIGDNMNIVLPILGVIGGAILFLTSPISAVVGVVVLLATAWANNWGGIRDILTNFWVNTAQPILQNVWNWLSTNVPVALETLRAFWVDSAWPAIQTAIQTVWPVVETIFTSLRDWVVNTLIPTVTDLYTKWTTEWWPTIQTVLENTWTVIEEIFTEVGRWINDNIIPWVEFFAEQWKEKFEATQTSLETVWGVIEPIWITLKEWLEEKIPEALNALQPVFEGVMSAISAAVEPVKSIWDGFVSAVQSFWDWITSHDFNFSINLPDLPEWATPGSPIPLHTAWQDFNNFLRGAKFEPQMAFASGLLEPTSFKRGGTRPSPGQFEDGRFPGRPVQITFEAGSVMINDREAMRMFLAFLRGEQQRLGLEAF